MPSAEELSRILVWIVGGLSTGFGLATPDALLQLIQPEYLGAIIMVVAAVWRAVRPPVVE